MIVFDAARCCFALLEVADRQHHVRAAAGQAAVISRRSRAMTAGGVRAGAKIPIQESISKPGTPDSVMVGNLGACGFLFAVNIAIPFA